ncbi:MAG: hypothetical protein FD138_4142, partial [Planctomycetota bacterium]
GTTKCDPCCRRATTLKRCFKGLASSTVGATFSVSALKQIGVPRLHCDGVIREMNTPANGPCMNPTSKRFHGNSYDHPVGAAVEQFAENATDQDRRLCLAAQAAKKSPEGREAPRGRFVAGAALCRWASSLGSTQTTRITDRCLRAGLRCWSPACHRRRCIRSACSRSRRHGHGNQSQPLGRAAYP